MLLSNNYRNRILNVYADIPGSDKDRTPQSTEVIRVSHMDKFVEHLEYKRKPAHSQRNISERITFKLVFTDKQKYTWNKICITSKQRAHPHGFN